MPLRVSFSGVPVMKLETKGINRIMRSAGQEVAALAKRKVRSSIGGGRIYYNSGGNKYHPYQKGRYTASSGGQSPVNLTGDLVKEIGVEQLKSAKIGVAVVSRAYYSSALENGSSGGVGSGKAGVKGLRNTWSRRGGVRKKTHNVGKRVLKPRPYMAPALEERRGSIETRVKDAVAKGVEFDKKKVGRI